eukprot:3737279-Rhodomonas_salina.4
MTYVSAGTIHSKCVERGMLLQCKRTSSEDLAASALSIKMVPFSGRADEGVTAEGEKGRGSRGVVNGGLWDFDEIPTTNSL